MFHDPSNLIALTSSPSIYSLNRRKALEYSLNQIEKNNMPNSCLAIFGDFNFRLDLAALIEVCFIYIYTSFFSYSPIHKLFIIIKNYSTRSDAVETKDSNDKLSRLVCKCTDKQIFTIEDKKFKWHNDFTVQSVKDDVIIYLSTLRNQSIFISLF